MKITKATFKSFLKKNEGKLFIKNRSDFDAMTDCVSYDDTARFIPVELTDKCPDHDLGIRGLWLVGQSRDYFTEYEDEQFKGIEVYNCCGTDIIAVLK